jgi:tripartite-type tricarboxylate transporter receptor subunit TctC
MPMKKTYLRRFISAGLLGLGLLHGFLFVPACTRAAGFPTRPVRIIVPSSPSGALDVLARILSLGLPEIWGQPVVVDNLPGANGIIGTQFAARAAPDGYTLVILAPNFTINPFIYKQLPYRTSDLQPITVVGTTPSVLVVNPSTKFRTIQQLIDQAKKDPDSFTYASSGVGSSGHMSMALLENMAGIKLKHVPYKGAGDATVAVMKGEVNMLQTAIGAALPQIQAGELIPIAITSATRSPVLPNVPTFSESGLPGYDVPLWYGLFAPAATPKDVLAKIHDDVVKVLNMPDVKGRINNAGLDIGANSMADFEKFIASDLKNWEKTITAAGIKAEQ